MTAETLPATAPQATSPLDVGAVYQREFDWVWHTLRRIGVAPRNLPDVTHDVFVVVHQRGHTYDPSRPLRPWLFGVAFRVARDHLRLGRNRHESVGETADIVDTGLPQDQRVAQSQA